MRKDRSLKRRIITAYRLLFVGSKNVLRNAWLSVAAMAVMFVALTILLFSVILNITTNNAVNELSGNLRVSVYLEDGASDADRRNLQSTLSSSELVESVEYVSSDDARARFIQSFREDESILQALALAGEDVVPASLEVSAVRLEYFDEIGEIASQDEFAAAVESVSLGRLDTRRTIEDAARAQQFVTVGSVFAVAVFTVISVLIIFNTIRIAIFTRSEEIKNMKLIGATPWYIRGPFLVEASIYGIVAGILASVTVYAVVFSVGSSIATEDAFLLTYDTVTAPGFIAISSFITIASGIVVGAFSSMLAMSKHLRLKHW